MHEEELSTADFHCNLTGRTALIIGASRGIDKAVAKAQEVAATVLLFAPMPFLDHRPALIT
jgi:hypothetical protein